MDLNFDAASTLSDSLGRRLCTSRQGLPGLSIDKNVGWKRDGKLLSVARLGIGKQDGKNIMVISDGTNPDQIPPFNPTARGEGSGYDLSQVSWDRVGV